MIGACCGGLNTTDATGCDPLMTATPPITVAVDIGAPPPTKKGASMLGVSIKFVPSGKLENINEFVDGDSDRAPGIQTKAASKTMMVMPAAMPAIPNGTPNFRCFFCVLDAWLIFFIILSIFKHMQEMLATSS